MKTVLTIIALVFSLSINTIGQNYDIKETVFKNDSINPDYAIGSKKRAELIH